MIDFTRRTALIAGAGALAGAVLPGSLRAEVVAKDIPPPKLEVEKGASLRVLRPSKFVQGDETLFNENTKKFEEKTGVKMRVDNESWEDLRPKTAVAANTGQGPDIIVAWNEDPHQYPDKCLDVTDLADYLGQKYGGWFPVAEMYGKGAGGRWIAIPIGGGGGAMCYRRSWVEQAGFKEFPKDFDGFLALCQALQKTGHPAGMTLGNAVGDSGWTYWVLWGFGSSLVDENNKVVVNNDNTVKALEYAEKLSKTFIAGTASWLDPSNNKAFLAGEIGVTPNGISIYYVAKTSTDAGMKAIAEDMQHAPMPVGPVGRPTEPGLLVNTMILKYTKYPNAAKEYVRFMMEKEQYEPWQAASIGYWGHPLAAYDGNPVWTADPKHAVFAHVVKNMLWKGYKGKLGAASAAVDADFIVPNMFAQVCLGQKTPKEAAAEAQRRAERYYKS